MAWCNQVVLIKMRVILIRLSKTRTETMQTCHFQNYIRYGQVIYIAFRSTYLTTGIRQCVFCQDFYQSDQTFYFTK